MSKNEIIDKRVYAFGECFLGVNGEIVMEHLKAFCGDGEMVKESERMNCYMQGRFSVIREINRIIKLRGNNNER